MGTYVTRADLERALSPDTLVAIFDDNRDDVADDAPINDVIERAEAEVTSWLIGFYDNPLPSAVDPLIKWAVIDFAVAFSFERHPDYVRTFGEEKRAERWKRATDRMRRIQSAKQRPPTIALTATPANVGGVVVSIGPRMVLPGSDGTSNTGDL